MTRNPVIARSGLRKFSKDNWASKQQKFKKIQLGAKGKATPPATKEKALKPVEKPFGKKGGKRIVFPRVPRVIHNPLYTELAKPRARYAAQKRTPLRKSIKSGTVLIVLAGRYAGKRVVFLKQLPSGLLLATGPARLNGVPLRRFHQSYVIATSTRVDVSGVKIPEQINDAYFRKPKESKKKAQPEQFFEPEKTTTKEISKERKEIQQAVDAPIIAAAKKVPLLVKYLQSTFALSKGQYPHQMVF